MLLYGNIFSELFGSLEPNASSYFIRWLVSDMTKGFGWPAASEAFCDFSRCVLASSSARE